MIVRLDVHIGNRESCFETFFGKKVSGSLTGRLVGGLVGGVGGAGGVYLFSLRKKVRGICLASLDSNSLLA
jgi:hypothetical protein